MSLAGAGASLPGAERIEWVGYWTQQTTLAVTLTGLVRLAERMAAPRLPRPPRHATRAVTERFRALLRRDVANVRAGYYPRDLLQFAWGPFVRDLPLTLVDTPRVMLRYWRNAYRDLPPPRESGWYPSYYLRNFHWQTDGWLSEQSARRYDVGVELLFGGAADVMRRMVLPPLVDGLRGCAHPRILDVGCGTGRWLRQAHRALPHAKLYGLDLSPYYLAHARKLLAGVADVSLVAENAEHMPFIDGLFDAVVSVFLFHELPSDVRRQVAAEMWRVVRPGGLAIVCDSAQQADSPELMHVLTSFPRLYHEPYYKGYLRDDLGEMLAQCGFEVLRTEPNFVAKTVVARRASVPAG